MSTVSIYKCVCPYWSILYIVGATMLCMTTIHLVFKLCHYSNYIQSGQIIANSLRCHCMSIMIGSKRLNFLGWLVVCNLFGLIFRYPSLTKGLCTLNIETSQSQDQVACGEMYADVCWMARDKNHSIQGYPRWTPSYVCWFVHPLYNHSCITDKPNR